MKYGLVIDITRCSGCGSCLLAVKDEYIGNDYPGYCAAQPAEGANWLNLVEVEQGEGAKVKMDYIPVMYRHDRNLKSDEAMYVRPDGLTIIDPVKAKGRRDLVCEEKGIFWNEELQIPQIYTLDSHRLDEGEKYPRCVESCPTQAMHWGDLDDPESDVSKFVAEHADEIEDYMPEEGADFVVRYYKLPKPFITGEVVKNGECAGGVRVSCRCECGKVLETETDFFGDFQFKYLDAGKKYTVTVGKTDIEVLLDKARDLGLIMLESGVD